MTFWLLLRRPLVQTHWRYRIVQLWIWTGISRYSPALCGEGLELGVGEALAEILDAGDVAV